MTFEEQIQDLKEEVVSLKEEIKKLKEFMVKETINANFRTRNEF
jgi:cell division protein FtsB